MATGPGYALGEIAHVLNARLEGDPTRIVTGVAPLESALVLMTLTVLLVVFAT